MNLGDKMKNYERMTDYELSPSALWVMRLDGCGFSKYTKKIKAEKPFDEQLSTAMKDVTTDLMERFGFVTGYCQSDEITLIPNLVEGNRMNPWNLRLNKLLSIVPSYASVRFGKYMAERGEELDPIFDARVFVVDEVDDLKKAILWRQYDCIKNAKNLVGQKYFSFKELQGLTSDEQIAKVEREYGVSFESFPSDFRYGALFKRVEIPGMGYNPISKEAVSVMRTVYEEYNELIPSTEFAVQKYWKN